jgi:hypothetical protein
MIEQVADLLGEALYMHQFKVNGRLAFEGDVRQWHQDYGTSKDDDLIRQSGARRADRRRKIRFDVSGADPALARRAPDRDRRRCSRRGPREPGARRLDSRTNACANLGFMDVITNSSGNSSFGPLRFPVPAGHSVISATASGLGNHTSEFSQCFAFPGPPVQQAAGSRKAHGGAGTFDLPLPP